MKTLLFLVSVGLLAACQGNLKLPDAPPDLIEKDSMVLLLKDMTVLESAIQKRYQNVNVYYKIMTASGKNYLKERKIDPNRFERSYDYYVSREAELQSIYEQVIDSLNKESGQLQVK